MKGVEMRRLTVYLAIALLTFTLGVVSGAFWYARQLTPQPGRAQAEFAQPAPQSNEQQWPLTPDLVSRAMQTRIISTKRLRRNGDDEVVWRWLKQSVAEYPQNWVRLNISEAGHYSVVIYRPTTLDEKRREVINGQLRGQGRPLLEEGKKYAELQVKQGDIECPDWYGLIDLDAARLMYFEGRSG